jgi:predicted PurR-regulated permease PerM
MQRAARMTALVPPLREDVAEQRVPSASPSDIQRAVGLVLLFVLLAGCFFVLRPFLAAILWAVILVISTWPLYRRLERLTGGRRSLAALGMTLALAALLLAPLVILGSQLTENVIQLAAAARAVAESGLPPPPEWLADLPIVGKRLAAHWLSYDAEGVRAAIEGNMGPIRDWVLARGADVGQGALQITLSLLTAFFLYRDAPAVLGVLQGAMSKVTGPRASRLAATARDTIDSVVRGLLGTSLIQAILLALGLAVAGVPGPILLGFISFFLSLIPMGLALLWVPAAAWLAMQDHTGWAVFMAIWGAVVGSLDNVTRPYLMAEGTGLPFLLILLGVAGGALTFGLVGLFLGPILLAIATSLVREWSDSTDFGTR